MRLNEKLVQLLGFLSFMPKENIGFYKGPLTYFRAKKHAKAKKKHHITVLGKSHYRHGFAAMTVYWINERSKLFSANLNNVTEKTDIIWIFYPDPIREDLKEELESKSKTEWKNKLIINAASEYNNYHHDDCFPKLKSSGVTVPRFIFTDEDLGKTDVIYKKIGEQTSEKFKSLYKGEVENFRPFEFINTANEKSKFHRYRAFYLFGEILPSIFTHSGSWNVNYTNEEQRVMGFEMTEQEIKEMHLISRTLNLDYFAVDFIKDDKKSYFIDVNIHPTVKHRLFENKQPYGIWHTFNFLNTTNGVSAWAAFDQQLSKRILEQYE